MATKIQRARRIGGLAIGAVKAIFRIGRVWGSTRTRVATARRPSPTVPAGAAMAVGAAGGAAGAYFLDPQYGKRRRDVAFERVTALLGRGAAEGEPDAGHAARAEGNGAGSLPDRDRRPAPIRETVSAGS
jgi:hypothetical protein